MNIVRCLMQCSCNVCANLYNQLKECTILKCKHYIGVRANSDVTALDPEVIVGGAESPKLL